MQNDQIFGQPDFTGNSQQQQHDIAALMASSSDMFGYPMTAPTAAPTTFWDPSMGMDFDFSASPSNVFQTTPVQHGHRHTGSFDWNSEVPLFQDPTAPFASANTDHMQTIQRDRPLAPKPMGSTSATTAASAAMSAALSAPLDDPFGLGQSMNGVNPGLLFEPPQNPILNNPALIPVTQAGSAEATIFQSRSRTPLGDNIRQSTSMKDLRATKVPDRALAPSPVKSNPRPGMGRSFSENRGKRTQTQHRPVLPKLAPARPVSQASNGSNGESAPAQRPIAKPTGRLSPMKSQNRLSSLASIPEGPALHHPPTRTAVKFTIDERGRARAETTIVSNDWDWEPSIDQRRLSRERSRTRELGPSDDESSSDDEPIIIPSRNNSFNASFALPDPLRPVGSIFHSSRRSVSDRSMSSIHDTMGGSPHDGDSETETVMHERRDKIGDAASELRKKLKMVEHNIVVLGGDHCGPEVVAEGIRVLKTLEENKPSIGKFNLHDHLMGGCSIDANGSPLTDETLAAAKAADAVLLGSIGGPEWGTGAVRPEQGLLKLRKEMGTYGNLRPCFFASESLVDSSPLKASVCKGTDIVIVRELTGGIYFGERKEDDGSGTAWDTEPYSRVEIERVARLAGFLARGRGDKKVWSLDKANVLATSRLWRKVMTETFEKEFPDLKVEHQLIDSAAMILVKNPTGLNGVVVTSNLFGDIISDEASVIPGSIGLLPSASLSGIPDGKGKCNGIYEPIHGSAPDISGKGIVNPIGTILSVAMLLRYSLNLPEEAKAVEDAVRVALDGGLRTKDLGGNATTKEVGDAVVKELEKILKA
ncbi:3-isopropylmalate dehydrogenase [Fusarium acuminatum]|uniref:3-isopropylmalate dehydrogenase n=1 Tax=Fusarium acuminatum TaxID=5515 RepID=A0ABZ2WWU6_9HYPO